MSDYTPDTLSIILALEKQGLVTRTFRRLDPERQAGLINAILEEAAEVGPANLNVHRVAERSGTAVGSLYQYFGNRDNLLSFAIEMVVRQTVMTFDAYQSIFAQMPLRDGLRAYLLGGEEWTHTQLSAARFFARAAYQGDSQLAQRVVRPIAESMKGMLRALLEGAAARGELRADLDLEAAIGVVNTLIIAVGDSRLLPYLNHYYQLSDANVDDQRALEATFALLERGLMAEGV